MSWIIMHIKAGRKILALLKNHYYASICEMHPSTKKPENVVDFMEHFGSSKFKSIKVLIGKWIKCSTAIFEILGRDRDAF